MTELALIFLFKMLYLDNTLSIRRMSMKKVNIFIITFLSLLCFWNPLSICLASVAEPEIESNIALMINVDMDTVVYQKNADLPTDPSSLTKVVTAALAFENFQDLDKEITVKEEAIQPLKNILASNAGIKVGEVLTMRQLLLCMMAQSANEAANVIAQEIGGSIEEFVQMMNDFVVKIGCTHTKFVNAHGISDEGQITTARDMALVGKYVMKIPGFLDLVSITSPDKLKIPATNISEERQLIQTNKMLHLHSPYYYKYAKGIKTGSSGPDDCCIMTTATKDGYTYLCIILEAPNKVIDGEKNKTNFAMKESKILMQWALQNLKYKTIVNSVTTVDEIPVEFSWKTDHVQLVPEKDISTLVSKDLDASGVLIVPNKNTLPEKIQAPASKGDVMGTADVLVAGESICTINLVLSEDVERSNFLYVLYYLKKIFTSTIFKVIILIIIILAIGYIILSIFYNRKRSKRNRKLRKSHELYPVENSSKNHYRSLSSRDYNYNNADHHSVHNRRER